MDIRCVVCGEPWYAELSDMEKWEADLFRKGAGCPCCHGEKPERGYFEPRSLDDVENGDGDPQDRIDACLNVKSRPRWEKPASTLLWKCDGCGVEILRDANGDLEYRATKPGVDWWSSHPYWKWEDRETGKLDEELREPAYVFATGKVCEFCLDHCKHCGKPISSALATALDLDTYSDGNSFVGLEGYNYNDAFCVDCVEMQCDRCGGIEDDCKCKFCDDDDDDDDDDEVS